ncbi:hypothetical protein ACFWVC_30205 [Streptomyces sp. NPDC058691]|uniref:hypothetical protein n=1 Tax=Streptomyces sp. NPDC058691 TaxID=3346601 RepID=UPI0036582DCB
MAARKDRGPAPGARWGVERSADGDHHWRMKANNGRVVAVSAEGRPDPDTCRADFKLLKSEIGELGCVMLHAPGDGSGWCWAARDGQGRTLAVSPRAYERYSTCQTAYERFVSLLADTTADDAGGTGAADSAE